MRRGTRLTCALLATAIILTAAFAQEPETLERYDAALASLRTSIEVMPVDPTASLDALESAATAMRRLAQDTSSTNLIEAMERVFDHARTAIVNRSPTDLAVQAAVLRGGFQRGLLEAALTSGSVDAGRPGLERLATDLQLDAAAHEQLAAATDLTGALRAYQAGVARHMAAGIGQAQGLYAEDRNGAYVALAGAYGNFLSVQDSPAAPADLNTEFVALVGALVDGRDDDFLAGAPALAERFGALSASLVAQLGQDETPQVPPADEDAAQDEPAAVADPAEAAAAEQPAQESAQDETPQAEAEQEAVPASPAIAQLPAVVQAPAAEEPAAAQEQPVAVPDTETPAVDDALLGGLGLDEARLLLAAEQAQQQHDALVNELARRGLRGQPGEAAATLMQNAGFTSLAAVVSDHFAMAARASEAVSRGDQAAASQYVDDFANLYRGGLAPVVTRVAPALDLATNDLLASLQASPVLRNDDMQTLTAQVRLLSNGIGGATPTLWDDVRTAVTRFWGGWPRQIATILLAVLAVIPLVLLRMAFGGGNRNWSRIGAGLFLLLLPVMVAGISELLALLGNLLSLPALHWWSGVLALSTPFNQAVWALLTLLGIWLAGSGFYGICRQFGLFGGTEGSGGGLFRRRARQKTETKTLVDWDEEF